MKIIKIAMKPHKNNTLSFGNNKENSWYGSLMPFTIAYPANSIEIILRMAVFGTYMGHGFFALHIKQSWIPLITSCGFSDNFAIQLLPLIGIHDFIIAFTVLVFPFRGILLWAAVWAFATAASRVAAGEHIAELIERSANFAAPLALCFLHGFPKSIKDLFRVRSI